MRIVFFAKTLAATTALAMLGVVWAAINPAVGGRGIVVSLVMFEALALAVSIVATVAYPMLTGVRKGEKVLLVTNDPVTNALIIRLATALQHAKLHETIQLGLDDGSQISGQVDSYQGIISPARVSVKPENNIRVI